MMPRLSQAPAFLARSNPEQSYQLIPNDLMSWLDSTPSNDGNRLLPGANLTWPQRNALDNESGKEARDEDLNRWLMDLYFRLHQNLDPPPYLSQLFMGPMSGRSPSF